jgi:GxxExxY protein
MLQPSVLLDERTGAIIGAAMEVHRALGPDFLESVYEEAMTIELKLQRLPFERQKSVSVFYKGHPVGEGRMDFFVAGSVVVELKAIDKLLPIHQAQLMSYLKATGCRLGLLINFHVRLLKDGVRRIAL